MPKPSLKIVASSSPDEYQRQLKRDVEQMILPIMLNLSHEALQRAGFTIREDVHKFVEKNLVDVARGYKDALYLQTVATKATSEATDIMKASQADFMPSLWVSIAHLILKIGNRGHAIHKDLALAAMAIETEIIVEEDRWGGAAVVEPMSGKMENEMRRRGFFIADMVLVN